MKKKPENGGAQKKYYLFDCRDKNFGRIATSVAMILQGKHKASYAPNKQEADFVVLTNISKVRFSGNKASQKMYHSFSGYPGGITSRTLGELMVSNPERIVTEAIYNMLPKNKLRDKMMKHLLIYRDEKHGLKVDFKKAT